MKTVSLFLCLLMAGYGLYVVLTADFVAGSVLVIIGGFSMLIIAGNWGQKKHPFYDEDSFMNK